MNVLVATGLSQGMREDDYNWCVEGELVTIEEPCARDRTDPVVGCGCSRGFAGVNSHRATTTARIALIPDLALDDYVEAIESGLVSQGLAPGQGRGAAEGLLQLIRGWPVGAILERSWQMIRVRSQAAGVD